MNIGYLERIVGEKVSESFSTGQDLAVDDVLRSYFAPHIFEEYINRLTLQEAALASFCEPIAVDKGFSLGHFIAFRDSARLDVRDTERPTLGYLIDYLVDTAHDLDITDAQVKARTNQHREKGTEPNSVAIYAAKEYIAAFHDLALLALLPRAVDAEDLRALLAIDCLNMHDPVLRTKRHLAELLEDTDHSIEHIALELLSKAKDNLDAYKEHMKEDDTKVEFEPGSRQSSAHLSWTCEGAGHADHDWSKGLTAEQRNRYAGLLNALDMKAYTAPATQAHGQQIPEQDEKLYKTHKLAA